ncbi:uncharacterized protein V6R79_026204 [Siganus canaliculatus]
MVTSAAIGGTLQYGYNLAIMNSPTTFIQTFINETFLERWDIQLEDYQVTLVWTIIVSIFSLGGLIGALIAGPMTIRFGRKKCLLLNNVFLMTGALCAVTSRAAKSFEMIILSRILIGINAGISMNVQPMYFGESAPKHLRGAISLSSAVFTAFGVVLGQVVGLREILGSESCWQYLLASNAIPGFIQLLTLPWFPESPRYLLIDRGDKEACIDALRRLRGCEVQSSELDEIMQEQDEAKGSRPKRPWELFSDRSVRWQLISVMVISSAMQLCGNDSIYFYASYVFKEAGISEDKVQYITIGTGTCEFTACIMCNLLIEHKGRRFMLMGGFILMTIWAVVFTIALWLEHYITWMPYLSMACVFTYILSFGMGPAGVTGVLPTEIFNQAARPAAYMIAGSMMWLNLFIIGMIFPFLVSELSEFCFVPFGAVCLLSALYVGLFLPETKGKSLSDITSEFHKLNYKGHNKQSESQSQAQYQLGEFQYWRLYLLSLVLGIGGSFQYGMQVSVIAAPEEYIHSFVNYTWMWRYGAPVAESTNRLIWSFIVAVLCIGAWAGAIHSGSLPVKYGRKKALLINNVVAIVAALLMLFSRMAQSFEMILLARFLYGYNVGLGLSVHLMYLGESSPKALRGFLTLTGSIILALGKVLGQIVGIKEMMGTEEMWPYLLAVSGIPAILQFVLLLFFPEAPRYLYIDKGDVEGAKKALQWLWQEDDLKLELDDMQRERESTQGEKAKTVKDVLTSRCVRWQLLTLTIPCAGSQFCGMNALYFYAFNIFRESGVAENQMHYMAIGIGATEFIAVTLSSYLIDRAGRKKLMGGGYLAMGAAMSVLTVMLSIKDLYSWVPFVNIGLIFCVICMYGLGPSGVTMALPADLFLQAWRPSAYVISGTINWLSMFLVGMSFGYIVDGLGQFCFLIFVAYCIFSAGFLLYFIPETKGKTMVEVMEDFNKLNFKNRGADAEKTDVALATKF